MTLTEAAFWTKRFGVILLVLLALFSVTVIIITSTSSQPLPPEYLQANYACTNTKDEFIINKLDIPSLDVNSDSENIYELQTDTGKVNDLSALRIINVHKYREKTQQLDSQIKAKEIATSLGFEAEDIYRKGTTDYIWTSEVNSRSLNVEAKTLNFTMTTKSSYIRDVAKENPLVSINEAISQAKNVIRRLDILGSDYNYNDTGNITTHLVDINPDGTFSEAPSLAEAELIKVDFRKSKPMISIKETVENSQAIINSLNNQIGESIEDEIIVNGERIKVYDYSTVVTYSNPSSSNISVYVGPEDPNSELLPYIYGINFIYWQLEAESCGTYELVSPSTALQKVQEGEGSLVYLNDKNGDEIENYQPRSVQKYTIYDIDIAYYESSNQPAFLQPIYVITGETLFNDSSKGEFHIFYPAINYDIVQDKSIEEVVETDESDNGLLGL